MFMKMSPASGQPSRREDTDMILASSSADAGVRFMAVKELIKSISGKEVSNLENVVCTSLDIHRPPLEPLLRNLFGMLSFLAFKIAKSRFWKLYMRTQPLLQSCPQIRKRTFRHCRWLSVLQKNPSAMFFDVI